MSNCVLRSHQANASPGSNVQEENLDVLDSVDIPLPLVPILEAMACPALVPEITSDKRLTSILTDAHLDTWFHVQDANDLAATLKETRRATVWLIWSFLSFCVLCWPRCKSLSPSWVWILVVPRVQNQSLPKQWILRRFCALTLLSLTTRPSWGEDPSLGNISVRTVHGIRTMTFSVLHTGWTLRAELSLSRIRSC